VSEGCMQMVHAVTHQWQGRMGTESKGREGGQWQPTIRTQSHIRPQLSCQRYDRSAHMQSCEGIYKPTVCQGIRL